MSGGDDQAQEAQNKDSLPDWARKQISDANAEAAKYRTEKREAVEAAERKVTESFQSRIEELEASMKAAESDKAEALSVVEKLKVALSVGIKTDKVASFAALLQGDTEEELRSHAEELKALFTNDAPENAVGKATDSSQGNVPNTPLNGDPLLVSLNRILKIT